MKKSTWVKIASIGIASIPPIVVLGLNAPIILSRADKTISLAAIFVCIILFCVFKDAIEKYVKAPSALIISLVVFLLSCMAISLGDELFKVSLAALVGCLSSMPLNVWYGYLTRPPVADDVTKQLNEIREGLSKDEKTD